ncbi:deoxyribonuclease, partial [Halorubrum sp. E3]
DPRHGRGIEAVEEFARLGGTHLLVVNKPSWLLGVEPDEPADFRAVFEETLETVAAATDALPGRAWPVLGVHPGLISRLVDERDFSPDEARDLMRGGLEVASEYVADGDALALKSGRPHYDVSDAVWDASNAVTRRAFELGADVDCAVQLHTEATEDLTDLAAVAEDVGLDPSRVVKHYAAGELAGVTPSVMSDKERLERAAEAGEPFLMET